MQNYTFHAFEKSIRFIIAILSIVIGFSAVSTAQTANRISLVSINSDQTRSGNSDSFLNSSIPRSALSADGRYLVFESKASDLVSGVRDANFVSDVFRRDLLTGETTLVSVNQSGAFSGNGQSTTPLISSDGRFIAFESSANDLVPNDLNSSRDIFVRDMQLGVTTLVTANLSGEAAKGGVFFLTLNAISANGRFVLFMTEALDIVANDQNDAADVFVRDLQEGRTALVSVNRSGEASGNRTKLTSSGFYNFDPVMSADGRFVAFTSFANDLADNDNLCLGECDGTNGLQDVFVRDLAENKTTLVSINLRGSNGGNGPSHDPSISDDGNIVAFRSFAIDLVSNDRTMNADIFARDMKKGQTTLVSVNFAGDNGGTDGNGHGINALNHILSPNGRFAAFSSSAIDLTPNKKNILTRDVFVRDLEKGTTVLASVNLSGSDSTSNASNQFGSTAADFSADGRFLVFTSSSPDLAANDSNKSIDVFVRDLSLGITRLASNIRKGIGSGNGDSLTAAISSNGSVAAFDSDAADIAENDSNESPDVFAYAIPQKLPPIIDKATYKPSGKLSIKGDNFDDAAKLFVDGKETAARFNNAGLLIAKKLSLTAGKHEVSIVNSDGQISTVFVIVD